MFKKKHAPRQLSLFLILISLLFAVDVFANETFENHLKDLRKIGLVGGRHTGFAGQESKFYKLFMKISQIGSIENFKEMLSDKNPIVRCMGITCLAQDGNARSFIEPLINDKTKISFLPFGCTISEITIGFFVQEMIKNPNYFQGSNANVGFVKAEADIPRQADISVSGIFLDDPESTRRVIGNSVEPEYGDISPTIQVCNSKKNEILTLAFHHGDIRDSYSEFYIRSISEQPADCISPSKQIEHFITGKGIHLGMSKQDISKILGDNFTEQKNGKMTTLHYRIDDFIKSRFLEKYNMPAYYGLYHFEKDTLIKFEFGFVYP